MKKVDKKDWFEKGLELLASDGFQKITIDNMCTVLKVTKGSFYHHFQNTEGYVEALMKYWMEKNTIDFINSTETITEIIEKHDRLNELVSSASQKAEQVIRAWSFSNETVRQYVQQVDDMRMKYLIDINMQSGMDAKEAQDYSILEYGALIGVQQLCPNISKEDFKYLYQLFYKITK
jgi:Transcriptional regulator